MTVGSSSTPLAAGATVNFGSVNVGSPKTETFVLTNSGAANINLATLAVTGAGFQGPIGLSAPLQLTPGQMASFQVSFTPTSGTLAKGVLTVDTRTFNLTAQGLDLPLPSASIVLLPTAGASGQQDQVSISLASPSQSSATGTLTMAFQSSVAGVSDDRAIQFLGPAPDRFGQHFAWGRLGQDRRRTEHDVPDRNHRRDHYLHTRADE